MMLTHGAHRRARSGFFCALIASELHAGAARAQEPPPTPDAPGEAPAPPAPAAATPAPAAPPPAEAAPAPSSTTVAPKVTVGGYIEGYYSYNFNQPSNGITNDRWLDNRHNSFALQAAVLDVTGELGSVSGHIALQAGPTASGWYSNSAEQRASSASTGPLDASTWRILQQATVGWKAPIGRGLQLQAGLFLTPIGFEVPAVKDNYNWSRSNLFLALPFYHVGVRAGYDITDQLSVAAYVVNGWNAATDNNDGKSGIAQVTYKIPDLLSLAVLYMGGPERAQDAPEGRPFRHLFDAWAELYVHKLVSIAVHGDAGFESNNMGTQSWESGAIYARVQPTSFLYLSARGDALFENVPAKDGAQASSIFFGSDMYSFTATADVRPADHFSFRAEYRHDAAQNDVFFKKTVALDATGAGVPNAKTQDTLTFGATAWF